MTAGGKNDLILFTALPFCYNVSKVAASGGNGGLTMATENTFKIKDGVTVTEEVVAIIAGLAACEADGVDCIGNGLTAANISKAGAGKLAKGIKVIRDENNGIVVRLSVILAYGFEIPAVSRSIQEKVASSIENMTGIKVKEVDVRISSVAVHS